MLKIRNVEFNASLDEVLQRLQVELNKRGINLLSKVRPIKDHIMITCPYHKNGQESRPSAQIREKDGLFMCFTCRESHTLPDVITHCLNEDGWKWLLQNFSSVNIEERKVNISFDNNKPTQQSVEYVPESELDKYRFLHPYMKERKLTVPIIKKFDVGYDSQTDCLTFPVKDKKGGILFIARRSVNTKFFSYPYGAKKPLYGEYELLREIKNGTSVDAVYICESILDALVIWCWGKYAVALNGVGSAPQMEMLSNLPCRTLILATDNDEGGRKARNAIRKSVKNKLIMEIDYSSYNGLKDINDMTKEQFLKCEVRL
jgi:DNA primase